MGTRVHIYEAFIDNRRNASTELVTAREEKHWRTCHTVHDIKDTVR
jgi:hypothetical protein